MVCLFHQAVLKCESSKPAELEWVSWLDCGVAFIFPGFFNDKQLTTLLQMLQSSFASYPPLAPSTADVTILYFSEVLKTF